ncbi:MAG: hypothetical protein QF916_09880, partial [Gammaproteobacteria bacterium]|nr:hypothetical protein [Gammaproteobacteria bacterium]
MRSWRPGCGKAAAGAGSPLSEAFCDLRKNESSTPGFFFFQKLIKNQLKQGHAYAQLLKTCVFAP